MKGCSEISLKILGSVQLPYLELMKSRTKCGRVSLLTERVLRRGNNNWSVSIALWACFFSHGMDIFMPFLWSYRPFFGIFSAAVPRINEKPNEVGPNEFTNWPCTFRRYSKQSGGAVFSLCLVFLEAIFLLNYLGVISQHQNEEERRMTIFDHE